MFNGKADGKDRILKYQLYREAGVKYYCIVDPETKSAAVFTMGDKKYLDLGELQEGKIAFDLGPCIIIFDFGEIFK
jgi:Uma2 family endonuclease